MKKLLTLGAVVGLLAAVVVAARSVDAAAPYPADINGALLHDGDVISANQSAGDPDIFIIKIKPFFGYANPGDQPDSYNGFKRLFLNPAIFNMYGHLGGFARVRQVTATVRDSFVTSGLFRNCETNDERVYATEVTGEDDGILHHVQMTGDQAAAEDYHFFDKVFCINTREDNFYAKSINPYYRLADIPRYFRRVCQTRPSCLDSSPRCMIAEPAEGWCPRPPISCISEGQPLGDMSPGICCNGLSAQQPHDTSGNVLDFGHASPLCVRPGCYYQQVTCVRAPCNPVLVCPTTNADIAVNAPNGGESYRAGQTEQMPLRWTASCEIKSFNVDLYAGGSYAQSMIQGVAQGICNAGDRVTLRSSWPIPASLASRGDYKVRVSGNSNGNTLFDESNSTFTVTAASTACTQLPDCAMPGVDRACAVDVTPGTVLCRYPFVNWSTLGQLSNGVENPWYIRVGGTLPRVCDSLGTPTFSVNSSTIKVYIPLISPGTDTCAQSVQEFSHDYPVSAYLSGLVWGQTYNLYVNGIFRGSYQYGQ